jgi:hypothetical protein
MLASIPLQSAQIISVAELGAQLLENVPIMMRVVETDLTLEVLLEIGSDTVVIE